MMKLSTDGISELCVPNAPKEIQKKTHLPAPGSSQSLIKSFATNESVMKADILWLLKSVKAHFSFNTNVDVRKLIQKIFQDSVITKNCLWKIKDELYSILWNSSLNIQVGWC